MDGIWISKWGTSFFSRSRFLMVQRRYIYPALRIKWNAFNYSLNLVHASQHWEIWWFFLNFYQAGKHLYWYPDDDHVHSSPRTVTATSEESMFMCNMCHVCNTLHEKRWLYASCLTPIVSFMNSAHTCTPNKGVQVRRQKAGQKSSPGSPGQI